MFINTGYREGFSGDIDRTQPDVIVITARQPGFN